MAYKVRGKILGFEDTKEVEITAIDELFFTMRDKDNENISFTLVAPYLLREYSFDLPLDIKALLDITQESKISVYNILVVQKPLEKSTINFLAPIVVNLDNAALAQAVLEPFKHPDFGMAETIESFKK